MRASRFFSSFANDCNERIYEAPQRSNKIGQLEMASEWFMFDLCVIAPHMR